MDISFRLYIDSLIIQLAIDNDTFDRLNTDGQYQNAETLIEQDGEWPVMMVLLNRREVNAKQSVH